MSLIPLSREQLQAEGVDGIKRAEVKQLVKGQYGRIVQAARQGQKEFFFQCPEKMNLSYNVLILHDDITSELNELFPGVTITSIKQKGAAQVIYQQAGILLDWS
jgi:hypothetical protein